jgi:hypothetical protein
MERSRSSGTYHVSTSEVQLKSETADAQVIRSLREELFRLKGDKSTKGKGEEFKSGNTVVVDSTAFSSMQLQLRQLLRREQQQVRHTTATSFHPIISSHHFIPSFHHRIILYFLMS